MPNKKSHAATATWYPTDNQNHMKKNPKNFQIPKSVSPPLTWKMSSPQWKWEIIIRIQIYTQHFYSRINSHHSLKQPSQGWEIHQWGCRIKIIMFQLIGLLHSKARLHLEIPQWHQYRHRIRIRTISYSTSTTKVTHQTHLKGQMVEILKAYLG